MPRSLLWSPIDLVGVIEREVHNGPPLYMQSSRQVTPEDIKAWLLTGLQEEDEEVKKVNSGVTHAR